NSASAISTTKTISPIPRTCFGSKPRPRNSTGRTTASDIHQLLICCCRLFVHQVPEQFLLGGKFRIGEIALGQRNIDIDDFADAARAARQNHDAMPKAYGFGKVVSDVDGSKW